MLQSKHKGENENDISGYCMNLSSLRPYEVTDFGETTIHGDDQAKNEVCYTSGMYLILHGKIIV